MTFRQITLISQDIVSEAGRELTTPCRRVAACGVLYNPYASRPAADDVSVLAERSFAAARRGCPHARA
jgi:hypothetical protein